MNAKESNLITFKKNEKTKQSTKTGNKENNEIYDSIFTPELHKQLLEKARKENVCD